MLNPQDFIIETYNVGSMWFPRFTGIRITHLPTKTMSMCDTEKSAWANRNRAWNQIKIELEQYTDSTKQRELF